MNLPRRHLVIGTLAVSALGLSGCASLNTVTSEVTSFGQWPEGRGKGRYLIERLPSQLAQTDRDGTQAAVEEAAHQALQRAGFARVGDLASADVVVQIGARITRFEISPWQDPLWWRWGPSYWRGPAWTGWRTPSGVYWRQAPMPEREVAILLRDRATSQPLWEARATSSGSGVGAEVFTAMFTAALSDFPKANPQPRNLTIPLGGPVVGR